MTDALDKWMAADPRLLQYRRWPENVGIGLTFEGAMMRYAADRQLAAEIFIEIYNDLEDPGDYSPVSVGAHVDKAYPELPEALSQYLGLRNHLIEELLAGRLVAKGFRLGSLEQCSLPAAWWTFGTIDIRANTVSAHGSTISGLMIFPGEELSLDDQNQAPPSIEYLRVWQINDAKKHLPQKLEYDDAVSRCYEVHKKLGTTVQNVKDARKKFPDEYKKPVGRPRKSSN